MKNRLLTIVFCLLFHLVCGAEDTAFSFYHFRSSEAGLSFDDVKCITQDWRSNIWIGTRYGLNRFDGTGFTNYFKEDLHTDSDFIRCLYEDRDGRLWVGTGVGVTTYDFRSDSFLNPYPDLKDQILCITPDCDGNLLLGSEGNGNFYIRSRDGSLTRYCFEGINAFPRMVVSRNNEIFLYAYSDNIYRLDRSTGLLKPFSDGPLKDYFKGDDIAGMLFSKRSDDVMFVLGKRVGLCEVNLKKGSVRTLYHPGDNQKYTSMRSDADQNLYLASTSGLIVFNLNTGKARRFCSNPNDAFSLSDNNITCSFQDDQGNLWVASAFKGLNCAARNHARFHKFTFTDSGQSLAGCNIRAAAQDWKGMVWIASDASSLLAFDPATGSVKEMGRKFNLPVITAICADGDELWLGSRAGMYRLNPETGKKHQYPSFSGGDFRVMSLMKLNSGDILAGTTGGMMKYNRETDTFEEISEISSFNADALAQDGFGVTWAATYSLGVYAYDIESRKCVGHFYREKMPDSISSILVDDRTDDVWATTYGAGFFKYDREKSEFISYDRSKLASLPSNVILSGQVDSHGQLWLSTDKGLVYFDPSRNSARTFGIFSGLLDDNYSQVSLKLSNGDLFFASQNGFVTFNPSEIIDVESHLETSISSFSILSKTVVPGPDSPIDVNVDLAGAIRLSHQHNAVSLRLASPKNLFGSRILFCELKGVDESPREVPSSGIIDYYEIPYGSHYLDFFSIDSFGERYETHKRVEVIVEPPFWLSGSGIMLITVLAILAISASIAIALRISRRRQDLKFKELSQAKEAKLLQEKMTFFSNIIHEIKTPLTLIQTPLKNLISMDEVPDSAKGELKIIENSSDSMDKLVKELLEFIRVEERGYIITRRNVDFVDRLDFLLFNFSDSAKTRNLKIDFIHSGDSFVAAVDSKAIDKILNNLLHNALKYAERFIRVELLKNEDRLIVRVVNDGPPIPAERREEIFKPFVQFSNELAPYSQSFGIGLALARSLVELHGGTLTLEDGEFTCFSMSIPVFEVPEEDEEILDTGETQDSRPSILIVEDNARLLEYLRDKMASEYNVTAVCSAEAALKVIEEKTVNIILTDIGLSRMSGVELCRRISSDFSTSHIPVVVVSAISSENMKIKCIEAGASMYIEKPFTIEYLRACVSGILSKRAVLKSVYSLSVSENLNLSSFDIVDRDVEFLTNLERIVMENISSESFSVKQLESELMMSHTALYKKINGLLNTSPVDYIRSKRLMLAAQMIRSNGAYISEVCYKVGFSSPSYFTKCFRDVFGMTPTEYARKNDKDQ